MSFIVNAGDCFLLDPACGTNKHFFYVISNPISHAGRPLVLVPITSVSPDKRIDPSCVLSPGEHHCCVKSSYAFYRGAILLTAGELATRISRQTATPKPPPASAALLKKLQEGAEESDELLDMTATELYQQGVIALF